MVQLYEKLLFNCGLVQVFLSGSFVDNELRGDGHDGEKKHWIQFSELVNRNLRKTNDGVGVGELTGRYYLLELVQSGLGLSQCDDIVRY